MQKLICYVALFFVVISFAIEGVMIAIWKWKIFDLPLADENKLRPNGLTDRQALLWKMKVIARWIAVGLLGFVAFTQLVGLARM
jgi:hypothetical protein